MGNELYSAEGVCYILTENLDLCSREWSPIGSKYNISGDTDEGCTFRGSFDGNGKKIKNVKISEAKSYYSAFGLFGEISSATLHNIDITRVDYNSSFAKETPVGGLVGSCTNSVISQCGAGGTVYAERGSAGGLIGSAKDSTITDCSANIDITGAYAGGLICTLTGGSIADSTATGKLYAIDALLGSEAVIYGGGLVGFLSGAEIRRSSSSVEMSARSALFGQDLIGAFAGKGENSLISDSFATGSVTLSSKSSSNGALAAGFLGNGSSTTTIQYCYSRGNVEGSNSDSLLGFAGYAVISDCYSTSNVTGGYRVAAFCMGSTATRCISFGDASGCYASAFNSPRASVTQSPIEPNKYNSCIVFGDVIAAYTAPATRTERNCVFYEAESNCYRAENITATENGAAISGSELGGEAMFFDVMNSADFYTFDEGFALAWDFSEMDVAAYKYPRLLSEAERNG
ncbi:MAG: hypothetical protein IJD51_01955 [Clostridia bacterium]|nr:hypothetical protein [Clostridia bacterium]